MIELGLLLVALFWGATYPLSKDLLNAGMTASDIMFFRFAVALPLFFLLPSLTISSLTRLELRNGAFFGLILFVTLLLELIGMEHTTATNAGFLVTLTIVFVLLFEVILDKKKVTWALAAVIATFLVGAYLLTTSTGGGLSINSGDLIIIGASLVRGFQFYIFAKVAKNSSANLVNTSVVQFAVVTLLLVLTMPFTGSPSFDLALTGNALYSILALAVLCTFYAFVFQLFASRRLNAMKISFILSTEPIFAALLAVLLLREDISTTQYIGGALLVGAAAIGKAMEDTPAGIKTDAAP